MGLETPSPTEDSILTALRGPAVEGRERAVDAAALST
jgi:hypothetical protein